jgi:hypothetical protein
VTRAGGLDNQPERVVRGTYDSRESFLPTRSFEQVALNEPAAALYGRFGRYDGLRRERSVEKIANRPHAIRDAERDRGCGAQSLMHAQSGILTSMS